MKTHFAVFTCGWKLDIGNTTRETEKPVAIFVYEHHAKEFAKKWPSTAEVRPFTILFEGPPQ